MNKITQYMVISVLLSPVLSGAQISQINSSSKILVISDIDDTLKVASSRNKVEFLALLNNTTQYTGLSELFQKLSQAWGSQIQFAYVTNAPWLIGSSRQKFLTANSYAEGPVYYNPTLADANHKYKAIRKLITDQSPTHVIFLGDNASRDAQVYVDIMNEYKSQGLQFSIFIHRLYPDLFPVDDTNYFSYITSIEIAKRLQKEQFLNRQNYEDFFNLVYPQIVFEIDKKQKPSPNSQAFPQFMKCSDYKWSLPLDLKVLKLQAYLLVRCK